MFNGSNCDLKAQLSGILAEPLNPRDLIHTFFWSRENIFVFSSLKNEKYLIYAIVSVARNPQTQLKIVNF